MESGPQRLVVDIRSCLFDDVPETVAQQRGILDCRDAVWMDAFSARLCRRCDSEWFGVRTNLRKKRALQRTNAVWSPRIWTGGNI
jgi:hypothetical protein